MTTFEMIIAIINVVAIIVIPIFAVLIAQFFSNKSEKRKDKMQIFQCLMTRRTTGWVALEAGNA